MNRSIVAFTVLFASGIALQARVQLAPAFLVVAIAVLAGVVVVLTRGGRVPGVLVALLVATWGCWTFAHRDATLANDGLGRFIDGGPVVMHGVVVEWPDVAEDRVHYVLQLERVEQAETVVATTAKVRVTVANGSNSAPFGYGRRLQVRAELRRPEPASNPGSFDYRAYLHRRGITATAYVAYPRHVVDKGEKRLNPFIHGAGTVRQLVKRGLQETLSADVAAVVAAVTLGLRRGLPPGVEDEFRRAGVSHLLAVSGLHVGFLAAASWSLLRLLRVPRPLAAVFAVVVVWTYVAATGGAPSAVRAGIGSSLGVAAVAIGRARNLGTALALAAAVLLVANPALLFDVSFQLSFAATGAILLGLGPVRAWLETRLALPATVATPVALTVAAQAGVAPLLAHTFQQLSVVGLVGSLAGSPLAAAIVPLGLVTGLVHAVWPTMANVIAVLLRLPVGALTTTTASLAALPWALVDVPRPSLLVVAATWGFGLIVVGQGTMLPRYRRLLAALCLTIVAATLWIPLLRPDGLSLTVVDVGQGDAIVIHTPRGVTALIDGGGGFVFDDGDDYNPGRDIILPYLRYAGRRRVDVVVNTHPHADHLQGLLPILDTGRVRLLVDSGQRTAGPLWEAYETIIDEHRIVRHVATPDTTIRLDEETLLRVLHPPRELMTGTRSDLNNNSVVLRLEYKDTSVLLTGDVEVEAQRYLLEAGVPLAAQVLKVPHHGSRYSLVPDFFEAVGAHIALIPVGRNNYGHPAPEIVAALQQMAGDRIFRTDVHGALRLFTDGRTWTVQPTLSD